MLGAYEASHSGQLKHWFLHLLGALLSTFLGRNGDAQSPEGRYAAIESAWEKQRNVDGLFRAKPTEDTSKYWLVGGLEHVLFSHILGMSSSQLTNSYFQRGRSTTNQLSFKGCVLAHPKLTWTICGSQHEPTIFAENDGRNLTSCDVRCLKCFALAQENGWVVSTDGFEDIYILYDLYVTHPMTEVFSRWYFGMGDNTPTRPPQSPITGTSLLGDWQKTVVILPFKSRSNHPHFLVFSKKNPPGKSSKSLWNPEVFGHFRSSMHPKIASPTAHVFLDRKRSNWQMRKGWKGWWPVGKKLDRLRLVIWFLIQKLSGSVDGVHMFSPCTNGFWGILLEEGNMGPWSSGFILHPNRKKMIFIYPPVVKLGWKMPPWFFPFKPPLIENFPATAALIWKVDHVVPFHTSIQGGLCRP